MNGRSVGPALVSALFLLGALAIPAHLAFEDHDLDVDGHHAESEHGDSSHRDSSHSSHPSSDHDSDIVAVTKSRPVQFVLAVVVLSAVLIEPASESFFIETDDQDPSTVPKAPRSPARAPPLV